jgi:hypothetical protein
MHLREYNIELSTSRKPEYQGVSNYSSRATKVVHACQSWISKLTEACSTSQATTNWYIHHLQTSTSSNIVIRQHHVHKKGKQDDLELFSCYNILSAASPEPALHFDDMWVCNGLFLESISNCCTSSHCCCCRLRPPLSSMVIEHMFSSRS